MCYKVMNIIKLKDLLKRCKQTNYQNELPLSYRGKELMDKPIEVIIDKLIDQPHVRINVTSGVENISIKHAKITR